jgi:hypothetical protein
MLGQPSISIPQLLRTGTIQLSPQREPPGASLERMAGMFMTQMQNMAATQNKFFEFMLGSGTAGGRQLRSLESVQDVRFLEDRRQSSALPALTHDTEMLVEELPESPQTPAAKTRLTSSTLTDTAKHVADPLESMLDALMVRTKAHAEVKAHAKAKAMPPPAKTASPVTDRVPDVAAATPSTAKKHKAATKVGSPPTAKAMASTPPSKAVASLASPSKSPSPKATAPPAKAAVVEAVAETSASAAVAKSKANATISKMSKDDLAAAMRAMKKRNKILGCAKCRFSHHGCSQCKHDDFAGLRWNPLVDM